MNDNNLKNADDYCDLFRICLTNFVCNDFIYFY